MPVIEQLPVDSSIANGLTVVFPYTFRILREEHLFVEIDGVLITSGYSVSGVGDEGGGSITFVSPPANGGKVVRYRDMPYSRNTDYQENGDLRSQTLDDDQDAPVMMIQQLAAADIRAIKLPIDETTDQVITAGPGERADTLIGFDAVGNLNTFEMQTGTSLIDMAQDIGASLIGYIQGGIGSIKRTMLDKMRESVSVKDFGAVGDGIAADDAAINAALAYIHSIGGGVVEVPAGDYRLTSILKVGSNTTLRANTGVRFLKDHDATFLNNGLGYDTSSVIPAYGGHGNIVIEGGVWEGFAFEIFDGYTGFALGFGKDIVIRNVVVKDSIGSGHAVDMSACDGVLFENCRFLGYAVDGVVDDGIKDCIQLDHNAEGTFPYFGVPTFKQNKNITVRGCYFGDNPDNSDPRFGPFYTGVGSHGSVFEQWSENILIENCIFDQCAYAGVRNWKWRNAKVINNTFNGCVRGIHITATSPGSESSKDIDRVQRNQAESMDGMIVKSNHFTDSTDYHVFFSTITFGSDTSVRHANAVISGNTFKNAAVHTLAIRGCNNLIVSGNDVVGGLLFADFTSTASEDVLISDNIVSGLTGIAGSNGAVRMNIAGATRIHIKDNSFRGVSAGRGIHGSGAVDGTITGNVFYGIAGAAIYLQSSASRWLISGNQFVTTCLTEDTTDLTPIVATSTCVGVVVSGNQNSPSNTSAPRPVLMQGAGGGYADISYSATPEAVITAPIGSICRSLAGGVSTTLYVKTSGTGNTGWVAK